MPIFAKDFCKMALSNCFVKSSCWVISTQDFDDLDLLATNFLLHSEITAVEVSDLPHAATACNADRGGSIGMDSQLVAEP